ncbi:TerD family protein [Polaromonas sp. YR568]|uniref:TerD family protein n=1 Tax=Polaromonas sp. YR568 TaxID=1855301 RepID=UPI00398BEDAE
MNEIYFRRKLKLVLRPGQGGCTPQQVATVQREIEELGYVLSQDVVDRLATMDAEGLARALRSLFKDLSAGVGAHRKHVPLYPGFPLEVMKLTEVELYQNAVQHYLTLQRLAVSEQSQRSPMLNNRVRQIIDLGTVEDFEAICTRLAGSAASLSAQDKSDLEWFVRQYRTEIFRLLPQKFPFKENVAHLGALLLEHVQDERSITFIEAHFTTATDVLRLAVGLSGGDVSLTAASKFKSFSRKQRKMLLGLLERSADPVEDMLRRQEQWKRLGERLHPGEYARTFPVTLNAFDTIRSGKPYSTFNSRIENALAAGNFDAAIGALEGRPGEFARRLDVLLRKADASQDVLQRFEAVAVRVSTSVLLQVLTHFKSRSKGLGLRVFAPKGDAAKLFAIKENRPTVKPSDALKASDICEQALLARFSKLAPLGRCFVDKGLAKFAVPLTQRAASKSLRTLARGSRVSMPPGGFVRMFLWWMNGSSRTDIDLSAVFYGGDYQFIDSIAFYNLRGWGAHHSGDIVDAPKGAAEFIDLDIQQLRARGVRFVVMSLNSYSGQPYCNLPECFAGWMSRTNLNSGEIFEARTVVDRIDLASDARISLPLVLDLDQREVLWADIALKENPRFQNSVHGNLGGVSLMLRALCEIVRPDMLTLMTLHARARGELVDDPKQANTVIGISRESDVSPLDGDLIRACYLQ